MHAIVTDHGAICDGSTNSAASIQRTIDLVASAGGGTVVIPAGSYVSGTLWMRSHVTLFLEAGATLLGSERFDDYPVWDSAWEGPQKKRPRAALISGEGLADIAIVGRGTIDGRGSVWWKERDKLEGVTSGLVRPRLIRLINCTNVLIEGVTCTNSPSWTVNPVGCDNVTISKITVRNPKDSPNTDGINPDGCRNVRISDCHIDVGDDCITIKSGSEEEPRLRMPPCENITITNCTMENGHGGVVIGSEMSGGVRNVVISNCIFYGTDRGIRIKTRRGRGGAVEDVSVTNVIMDGVECALVLNMFYGCGAWDEPRVSEQGPCPVTDGTPAIRRLRFSRISARRVKYAGVWAMGLPEMRIDDVVVDGMSIHLDGGNTKAGPCDMAPGILSLCRAGIWLKHVRNCIVNNVDVSNQRGPVIQAFESSDVVVNGLWARTPDVTEPLMTLRDVTGARVCGCHATGAYLTLVDALGDCSRHAFHGNMGQDEPAVPAQRHHS
jgi:hypothetical protein